MLSAAGHLGRAEGEFVDLEAPVASELADATEHHRSELDFALAAADADARKGDFGGALGWLRLAEELNLVLPRSYLERRESWRERQDAHVG
jgi:hypothetical protein